MIWAGMWADGTTQISFVEGNQKSTDYIYTLSEYLLPSAHLRFGTNFIFQQDNARIHTARNTKDIFNEENIDVMDWPALSPDLNPIENVWGYLVQQVYPTGTQYFSKEELKRVILHHWSRLDPAYLEKLVLGMKNRCIKVLQSKGKTIAY
jgi:hypothetical protein